MATHSRILAWRIPWTEGPGGLQSMGSQSWTRLKQLSAHARAHTHTYAKHSVVYLCRLFSSHSLVDEHLDCFHVLAIITSAAMNIEMPISFQIVVLSGDMPRSRIVGS